MLIAIAIASFPDQVHGPDALTHDLGAPVRFGMRSTVINIDLFGLYMHVCS